jgi:hypothetical protein
MKREVLAWPAQIESNPDRQGKGAPWGSRLRIADARFDNRVLPHSWCKLSPPKTCKQLKLCEIERFCTESPESASPGLIAQSNRLRISNLVTFRLINLHQE